MQGEMSKQPTGHGGLLRWDGTLPILAALVTLFHLLTTAGYGIFRDELYYLACAEHLDWGYVDHPPLVVLLAWVVRNLLGTSLFALRLLPALSAGVLVLLTGAITQRLGGGRWAQWIAGAGVALAPVYLSMLSIYSMNALDLVFWAALVLVMANILATDDGRLWIFFGALAGLGLQNKLSVLFVCMGLGAGLLLIGRWGYVRDSRLWIGAGLAGLIFLPHILWQVNHGRPTAEFMRRATETKNVAYAPLAFVGEQVMMMNPAFLPVWLGGLVALLFAKDLKTYRALGLAYLVLLVYMTTQAAKPYYLGPIYPALFAAGGWAVERVASARGWRWLPAMCMIHVTLAGLVIAPLGKPLLPVDRYVAYTQALGVTPGTNERKTVDRLPQFYADMHGWPEMAEAVAEVHGSLSFEDQGKACIFAQNYGQAGAMDLFGPDLGLPPVISGHNNYWLWGPGECTGEVLIIIGGRVEDHRQAFESVEAGGVFDCMDCMPYEDEQTLWIARNMVASPVDAWSRVKHFD